MSLVFTVLVAFIGTIYYGIKISAGKSVKKAADREFQAKKACADQFRAEVEDIELERELEHKWNTSQEFAEEAMTKVYAVIDSIPEIKGFRFNYKENHGVPITGKKKQHEVSCYNWWAILTILMAQHGKIPRVYNFSPQLWPLYGEWPEGNKGTNDQKVRIALMRWLQHELRSHGVNTYIGFKQDGVPGIDEFKWGHWCNGLSNYKPL